MTLDPDVTSLVVSIFYKSKLMHPLILYFFLPKISSPHCYEMGKNRRQSALAKSIQSALLRDPDRFKRTVWGQIIAFFTIRRIKLIRHERTLFAKLRQEVWDFDEHEYQASFHMRDNQPPLKIIGDLGYSGSVNPRSHGPVNMLMHFIRLSLARLMAIWLSKVSHVSLSIRSSNLISWSRIMNICKSIRTLS